MSTTTDDNNDKIICRCLGIAESEIRAATDFAGCRTLCDIRKVTSAGKGCMSCHGRIKQILRATAEQRDHSPADSPT